MTECNFNEEEVERFHSVLYSLYSVAYTYSDIAASEKGRDVMMKAKLLLDEFYKREVG